MISTPICPSCKARLRLAKPVAAGAALKCPRCTKVFRVPAQEELDEDLDEPETPKKPRQAISSSPPRPAGKKPIRARDDEEDDEDMEERRPKRRAREDEDDEAPSRKKKGKGKKQAAGGKGLYVLLGVGGAVVAVGVVVLILILNSGGNGGADKTGGLKGGGPGKEKELPPHPAAERLAGKADLTMTADELGQEMRKDYKATFAKYKGKVIALSGVMRTVNSFEGVGPGMSFAVKGSHGLELKLTEPRPWQKAMPGQSVKLHATVWEEGEPHLLGGPFKEVTGTPKPFITAEAFATEFQANPKAAEKKYTTPEERVVLLSAEVVSVASEGKALPEFVLKTGTAYRLKCPTLPGGERGVTAGMRVRVIGGFHRVSPHDPMELEMDICFVLPEGM